MKAQKIYICTFTNAQPDNGTWNLNALPSADAALNNAVSTGASDLIFKDGFSDMDGNVVASICEFKSPNFQDFLKAANAPAPPFVAIVGEFPDGAKRLYITKSPQNVKSLIKQMWLGEFGGNTQMPTNLGDGDGGWGQGDGGILCKLFPPLCALGFLPWLALAGFATYKAAESRSTTGKLMWAAPALLLWQGFFARGGVKQIQWWIKKVGIGGINGSQRKASITTTRQGFTFLNFFNSKEVYARQMFDTKRKALNYAKKYDIEVYDSLPKNIDTESILWD